MTRPVPVLTIAVCGLASMVALASSAATPDALRADAISKGASFDQAAMTPVGGIDAEGRCFGGSAAERVVLATPLDGSAFSRDTAWVCADLGTYWLTHEDARIMAPAFRPWIGPFPFDGVAGKSGLARRIVRDLEARGLDFHADGVGSPDTGPRGETVPGLDEGGVMVGLAAQPAGGADFFTDLAWVDPASRLYWAHRSGGFAGVSLWLGPFAAPLRLESAPSAITPDTVRVRRRNVVRTFTIFRDVEGDSAVPVRRRDYRRRDIDLGVGIRVLRVLRADRESIRVRVRVSRRADSGDRVVRVRGVAGDTILRVE